MKKKLLAIAFGLTLVGCAPTRHWQPDTVYTETSTYDQGDHFYQEAGVSGAIGNNGARMDVFAVANPSTKGDRDNYFGGGVRFEIPLGK